MLEGQDGLNWARWRRIALAAEEMGFAGLYRSDHFSNPDGPHLDALDLWTSLTWLATATKRIEFGPLVSPVSFRNPVVTAWTAAAVDDLSGGRLQLGMGAGWQEREHRSLGFDLLGVKDRFARFEEGLRVTTQLLRSDVPSAFDGRFYHLEDALLLPRPARPCGPPIVIGGNGPKLTLPLTAAYADEWNAVFVTAETFAGLSRQLDDLLTRRGRHPGDVRRTLMTRIVVAKTEAEAARKLGSDPEALRAKGGLIGTPDRIVADLVTLAEAGVQRVMLQWLELDDLDGIEYLATSVLPQLSA